MCFYDLMVNEILGDRMIGNTSDNQEGLLHMVLMRLKSAHDNLLDWTYKNAKKREDDRTHKNAKREDDTNEDDRDKDLPLLTDDVIKDFMKELVQFALFDCALKCEY